MNHSEYFIIMLDWHGIMGYNEIKKIQYIQFELNRIFHFISEWCIEVDGWICGAAKKLRVDSIRKDSGKMLVRRWGNNILTGLAGEEV